MKIVEQTPNRLRLRANKLKGMVGMVLVGTLFLLGGLWVMLIFRGKNTPESTPRRKS
jgi:hypothetical protein